MRSRRVHEGRGLNPPATQGRTPLKRAGEGASRGAEPVWLDGVGAEAAGCTRKTSLKRAGDERWAETRNELDRGALAGWLAGGAGWPVARTTWLDGVGGWRVWKD